MAAALEDPRGAGGGRQGVASQLARGPRKEAARQLGGDRRPRAARGRLCPDLSARHVGLRVQGHVCASVPWPCSVALSPATSPLLLPPPGSAGELSPQCEGESREGSPRPAPSS